MALFHIGGRAAHWLKIKAFALLILLTTICQLWTMPMFAEVNGTHPAVRLDAAGDEQKASQAAVAVAGIVLDPSAAAISGARVTLKAQSGVEIGHTSSNGDGRFSLEKVPPGIYRVDVEASGFRSGTQNIAVGADRPILIRITLQIASQNEVVTVGGEDLSMQVTTDVAENQDASTIDRNALDRVPVFDQDYITTLSRFLDDSSIGTNGVTLVVK